MTRLAIRYAKRTEHAASPKLSLSASPFNSSYNASCNGGDSIGVG